MKYFKEFKKFKLDLNTKGNVKFSPDCINIALSTDSYIIQIWDIKSEKKIQSLVGHSNLIYGFQYSANGKEIMSCSKDSTIRLWNVKSGQEMKQIKINMSNITHGQFSGDGIQCLFVSDGLIRIFAAESGKEIRTFRSDTTKINDIRFSPDGNILAFIAQYGLIQLWSVQTGSELMKLSHYFSDIATIQFSPDGDIIATIAKNGKIQLWDTMSGKEVQAIQTKTKLSYPYYSNYDINMEVRFTSDGQMLVSCVESSKIQLWDLKVAMELQELKEYSKITGFDISPDNNIIVSCFCDKIVQLWKSF
ncbi:WD-40 repeat-containing protein [Reticulomyxa filosa]|uniref:WD-40 repeat-containing protein n=1 Tax=Reticulomyxa filosa TaxID=46433 RepID=X6LVH8_RETFI|nr:WD-40 repeat-containing protein [Reticulomyxa filosa]|eukprot:ETO04735.1 WD-40 repeat-containing protein [Reticulomyxa filosa]